MFDSAVLSRIVDQMLIVVAANQTPRKLLGEALNLVDPAKVMGIVFNRDDRPLFGYYDEYLPGILPGYVWRGEPGVRRRTTGILAMQANLLILGAGPMAARLIDEIEALEPSRYVVVGVVDNQTPDPESPLAHRWLGTCDELDAIVTRVRPSRIVMAVEDRRDGLPLQSLLESRVSGIDVEDAIELYERITGKIAIEALRPSSLILSKGFRNYGAAEMMARLVSVLLASVGLLICAPLLAAHRAPRQARLRRARAVRPAARRPPWPPVRAAEVPDDASDGRGAVRVGDGQHAPHHAGRPLSAPVPARRAAAADQRPARRDEPDRAAPAPGLEPHDLHGAHRVLRPALDRAARA